MPGKAGPLRAANPKISFRARPCAASARPSAARYPHSEFPYVSFPSSWQQPRCCSQPACLGAGHHLSRVTVTAERLAAARNGIQTQTGASTYTITAQDIENQPGGDNTALNQVILQAPGVAQDSFGQLHIRGEHNGLQYRLNGIILPEGISVFGQTLDPRLAGIRRLITGALPAEYGNRTAGIIDIQTKTGLFDNGGEVSIYGGSHGTLSRRFAYGGSSGHFNYFVSGDYTTNTLGIESPDGSTDPLHDRTKQYHGFAFLQDILDQNSSVTAVLGTSNAMFQIPNQARPSAVGLDGIVGLGPLNPGSGDFVLNANGADAFPSENLDERQREITALRHPQLSAFGRARWITQVSLFGRYSSLFFTPGTNVGDLLYDGIAQTAYKRDVAYGLQAEGAWHAWRQPHHPLRRAVSGRRHRSAAPSSQVLPTAPGGPGNPNPNPLCTDPAQTCQTSATPLAIADNGSKHGWTYSLYLQDEWKLLTSSDPQLRPALRPFRRLRRGKPAQPARQSGLDADRHHHGPCRLCALFLAAAVRTGGDRPMSRCSTTPPRPRRRTPTTRPRPSGPTITMSAWSRSCSAA